MGFYEELSLMLDTFNNISLLKEFVIIKRLLFETMDINIR